MMRDKALIRLATDFRRGIIGSDSSRGMCAAVCWPLEGLLRFYGIQCQTISVDLPETNHIWIKLADGRALDPTADQFEGYPAVYLGEPAAIHRPERRKGDAEIAFAKDALRQPVNRRG